MDLPYGACRRRVVIQRRFLLWWEDVTQWSYDVDAVSGPDSRRVAMARMTKRLQRELKGSTPGVVLYDSGAGDGTSGGLGQLSLEESGQ